MATHPAQKLTVLRIPHTEAARAFAPCAGLDPQGIETPESAAAAGECFEAVGQGGRVAFALEFFNGGAWVLAAAGGGGGMAGPTLEAIERTARARGCSWVAFQTMRRGLQRIAQRQGYHMTEIKRGARLEKRL